jgi:hypothetical protein
MFLEESPNADQIIFAHTLLCKLWEYISGDIRPMPPKRPRSQRNTRTLYRTRLPKICTGQFIRHGRWDTKERDWIGSFQVSVLTFYRYEENPSFMIVNMYSIIVINCERYGVYCKYY